MFFYAHNHFVGGVGESFSEKKYKAKGEVKRKKKTKPIAKSQRIKKSRNTQKRRGAK
jgi:hypothetical protein